MPENLQRSLGINEISSLARQWRATSLSRTLNNHFSRPKAVRLHAPKKAAAAATGIFSNMKTSETNQNLLVAAAWFVFSYSLSTHDYLERASQLSSKTFLLKVLALVSSGRQRAPKSH